MHRKTEEIRINSFSSKWEESVSNTLKGQLFQILCVCLAKHSFALSVKHPDSFGKQLLPTPRPWWHMTYTCPITSIGWFKDAPRLDQWRSTGQFQVLALDLHIRKVQLALPVSRKKVPESTQGKAEQRGEERDSWWHPLNTGPVEPEPIIYLD